MVKVTKKKTTKKVESSMPEDLGSINPGTLEKLGEEISEDNGKTYLKKRILPAAAVGMLGMCLGLYMDKKASKTKKVTTFGNTVTMTVYGAYIGYLAGDAAAKKAEAMAAELGPKAPVKKRPVRKKTSKTTKSS